MKIQKKENPSKKLKKINHNMKKKEEKMDKKCTHKKEQKIFMKK